MIVSTSMLFRRILRVVGLRPVGYSAITFPVGTAGKTSVEWRSLTEHERATFIPHDDHPPLTLTILGSDSPIAEVLDAVEPQPGVGQVPDSQFIATVSQNLGGKPHAMLTSVVERRWPTGLDLPPEVPPGTFNEDGRLREGEEYPVLGLPSYVVDTLRRAAAEVDDALSQTLSILTWRSGALLDITAELERSPVQMSVDGTAWTRVASGRERIVVRGLVKAVDTSGDLGAFIAGALNGGVRAPVAHQMLDEARIQVANAPASALAIAVAAAEAGYKRAVTVLVPESTILDEKGAAPLFALLVDELPSLPARTPDGARPFCPDHIVVELRKAVGVRNLVVHRGDPPPRRATLERWIVVVDDLLWLLDYYCGHIWAAEYLSSVTRAALGLGEIHEPKPRQSVDMQLGETRALSAWIEEDPTE